MTNGIFLCSKYNQLPHLLPRSKKRGTLCMPSEDFGHLLFFFFAEQPGGNSASSLNMLNQLNKNCVLTRTVRRTTRDSAVADK